MRKKILPALTAALVFASSAAAAMTGAPYEFETGVEVLKSVSTESLANWSENGASHMDIESGSLHVSADGRAEAIMTAGADLYSETAPGGAMFWDFESESDVFTQVYGQGNLSSPADVPEGKMSNFYATSAYWTSPMIVPFSEDMYANATLGTVYTGERTPSAAGSGSAAKVTAGKNDWNRGTLGIRVKLSGQNFVPGKTYVLTYYTLDNSKDRELYCNVTKPSQTEPTSSGAVNWLSSSAEPIGRVRQYWTKGSTEVTPQEDDFEDGYAMLWLGIKAAPCLRSEAVYFDNVSLVPKEELADSGLIFRAKVKSDSAVSISGMLQNSTVLSETAEESDEWSDVSAKLSIDKMSDFFLGETRGKTDDFKITFGFENVLSVKDISIYKAADSERFENTATLAGCTVGITAKVFATGGEATAVLELAEPGGNAQSIAEKDVLLTEGKNTVSVNGTIPDDVPDGSKLMFYLNDSDGEIISERKQDVSRLYANGANICLPSAKAGEGILLFGEGEYLVEFDTSDPNAESAVVRIGRSTSAAAVKNGNGMCEIAVLAADITESTQIEIDGITAENITLKKISN